MKPEQAFQAAMFDELTAAVFLMTLGLKGAETMTAAADSANSEPVTVDVSQRQLNQIGRAIGTVLRACAATDAVTLRRLQNAVSDGMKDMAEIDMERMEPLLDVLYRATGNAYRRHVAEQVQPAAPPESPLILPPLEVVRA